jgi:hypothetical protein
MLLEELERLENNPPVPLDVSRFPYYFNSTKIVPKETLELFDMDLIADSLESNPYLEPTQPYHPRTSKAPIHIPALMHFGKMDKAPSFSFSRNLQTGQLDLDQIIETVELNVGDSRITTNLNREPSSKADFVRGNSSNLPFTPGGMTIDPQKPLDFIAENDEWETIAPGLERGIDFVQSKTDVNFSNILSGNDDFLQDYIQVVEVNDLAEIIPSTEMATSQVHDKNEKDVDNILFQTVFHTNSD